MLAKQLKKCFEFFYKHELLSNEQLYKYRKINRAFRDVINNTYPAIRTVSHTYDIILKILWYNKEEYDSDAYKRKLLMKSIQDNSSVYWNVKTSVIDAQMTELGEQFFVEQQHFPNEYYTLLHLYKMFPSTRIRLYPADIMSAIAEEQYKWLEQIVMNMQSEADMDNLLTFVPICYSKHFRQKPDDDQYALVLCYVNVVDVLLESEFPFNHERYYLIELPLEDLENNVNHFLALRSHIQSLSESIHKANETGNTMMLPRNIATVLRPFEDVFSELFARQKFNI